MSSLSSEESANDAIVTNAMRQERKTARKNQKAAAASSAAQPASSYKISLSNSTAYAGHLSSLVFGKIKSLWTAQTSTDNLGLNQLAGMADHLSSVCVQMLSFDLRCCAILLFAVNGVARSKFVTVQSWPFRLSVLTTTILPVNMPWKNATLNTWSP